MIGAGSDPYREGAAMARGLDAGDARRVSDEERRNFKRAFFATLWAYLHRLETQEDRDWMKSVVDLFGKCVAEGLTLEQSRKVLEHAAAAAGRG